MSMAYYVHACGRADIDIVPLYDPRYVPEDGDWIVLEPSRRFFETERFFDVLGASSMSRREIRVGPVLASTIYRFDHFAEAARTHEEDSKLTQSNRLPDRLDNFLRKPAATNMSRFGLSGVIGRLIQ